jgi:hypothetical protein
VNRLAIAVYTEGTEHGEVQVAFYRVFRHIRKPHVNMPAITGIGLPAGRCPVDER